MAIDEDSNNDIAILEGKSGNNFVAMPGYKTNQKDEQGKDIFRDICFPVTAEFRTKMFDAVLADYEMKIKDQSECSKAEASEKEQVTVLQNMTAKETPFR